MPKLAICSKIIWPKISETTLPRLTLIWHKLVVQISPTSASAQDKLTFHGCFSNQDVQPNLAFENDSLGLLEFLTASSN